VPTKKPAKIWGMKKTRLLGKEKVNYYHLVSWVATHQSIFEEEEKKIFLELMRQQEKFSGVRVLTYCIMPNHFHLLVEVTDCEMLSDEELFERFSEYYSKPMMKTIRKKYDDLKESDREAGNKNGLNAWRKKYLKRMGSLTHFGQDLKQKFAKWYNNKARRTGCLWASQFKSVLIEGSESALLTTAVYIDLNPVRAKLVKDPKDYLFCGYGESMSGGTAARAGICTSSRLATSDWDNVLALYQCYLFGDGKEIDPERIKEVLNSIKKLSLQEFLNCRVRYFSDGTVIGSKAFVENVFKTNRTFFHENRKTGARKIKKLNTPLYSFRGLVKEPIRPPD